MNKDQELIYEAWKGSLLQKSFDKENWSPLVKALEQASWSGGGSDKQIAIANIASHLFNLLSGKEGEVSSGEKQVLEEIGVNLLKLTKGK